MINVGVANVSSDNICWAQYGTGNCNVIKLVWIWIVTSSS